MIMAAQTMTIRYKLNDRPAEAEVLVQDVGNGVYLLRTKTSDDPRFVLACALGQWRGEQKIGNAILAVSDATYAYNPRWTTQIDNHHALIVVTAIDPQ